LRSSTPGETPAPRSPPMSRHHGDQRQRGAPLQTDKEDNTPALKRTRRQQRLHAAIPLALATTAGQERQRHTQRLRSLSTPLPPRPKRGKGAAPHHRAAGMRQTSVLFGKIQLPPPASTSGSRHESTAKRSRKNIASRSVRQDLGAFSRRQWAAGYGDEAHLLLLCTRRDAGEMSLGSARRTRSSRSSVARRMSSFR
jgi:hypothetical protein